MVDAATALMRAGAAGVMVDNSAATHSPTDWFTLAGDDKARRVVLDLHHPQRRRRGGVDERPALPWPARRGVPAPTRRGVRVPPRAQLSRLRLPVRQDRSRRRRRRRPGRDDLSRDATPLHPRRAGLAAVQPLRHLAARARRRGRDLGEGVVSRDPLTTPDAPARCPLSRAVILRTPKDPAALVGPPSSARPSRW